MLDDVRICPRSRIRILSHMPEHVNVIRTFRPCGIHGFLHRRINALSGRIPQEAVKWLALFILEDGRCGL